MLQWLDMFLYNTMTRKKQQFKPLKGRNVLLYTCGLTVYDYAHIGNLRAFIFEDLLRRVLEFNAFNVKHVQNFTDVGHLVSDADEGEDKMEVGAQREHRTAWQVADFYINAFREDIKKLRIREPAVWARATDNIQEMIELVKVLEKKKFTYMTEDGIYFDTSKLKDYGKLARLDARGLKAGARIEMTEGKRRPTDFALWKFSPKDKKRDMEWDFLMEKEVGGEEYQVLMEISKNNHSIQILETKENPKTHAFSVRVNFRGFPGWHIECSAMAMKYLGQTIDIHCGGVDHIPVHHTNEIAQSEAATGKKFVDFWLHNEFMLVDGRKMSKSLRNFYTLRDLADKGFSPLAFRYLCLSAHYRSQMNFTLEALQDAENTVKSINDFVFRLSGGNAGLPKSKKIEAALKKAKEEFVRAINDDLDMPNALAAIFVLMRDVNREIDKDRADRKTLKAVKDFFDEVNTVLDIIEDQDISLSPEEKKLVTLREQFRKQRDFRAADEIRSQLKAKGIVLEDTPKGVRARRVSK